MHIKLDWLSFSIPYDAMFVSNEKDALYWLLDGMRGRGIEFPPALQPDQHWRWSNGRAPYNASYRSPDGGVVYFVHPRLPHALVEISGRGCEVLAEWEHAADLLEAIAPRLTRIDLAADMLTDTRPLDFVAQRDIGRFKAHSEHVSESGETCYIGSKTSNRYARVYRYNPPHERAHLLRCEFVLKAEDAKLTAAAMLQDGHYAVAKALGNQFGWKHPDWSVQTPTEAELRAYRPERREGKTLFWLADTVAPLLRRLHAEGTIDAEQWFKEHVLRPGSKGDTL